MSEEKQTVWKIYKTTCLVSGKVYIGQTRTYGWYFKKYLGTGNKITSAINKYGFNNFVREILILCYNQEDADAYENLYIELYSSTIKGIGYNILTGATKYAMQNKDVAKKSGMSRRGIKKSPISIARMSAAKKGKPIPLQQRINHSVRMMGDKNPNFGKKTPQAVRDKIGNAQRGEKANNFGKTASPETRKKRSDAMLGEKHFASKRIESYNKNTGEAIEKFINIAAARRKYGTAVFTCLVKPHRTCKGYYWRYSK